MVNFIVLSFRWISGEHERIKTNIQSSKEEGQTMELVNYQTNKINPTHIEKINMNVKDDICVPEDTGQFVKGSCPTCEQKVETYDQLNRHLFLNHNLGVLCQEVSCCFFYYIEFTATK